ncbi:protein suppressor 2 of zeste [Drosophila takahashii]|uniref:protein suppressor 2 of zeste n=1 Tax=Drosophila takahashii TaxID=29030 RepID=UPI003899675C
MHLQITHKTMEPKEPHSDTESISPASRDVRQFHYMITCRLCRGYMIDPTTVDICYHTYCRSCILKHLLRTVYCPDCKASGGKEISELNLKSDDTLRSLIYKLVPGLYQRECKELADFEKQHEDLVDEQTTHEQEFFTTTELVSLSLEYHPAMLHQCGPGEVPPTIYLQCAAGLRVELLKRFLCSKYNIEAENKMVEVEVTYEDEVLPSNFTLMDVGYCYNWSRQSPMAFCYRILLYENEGAKNDENNLSRINQDIEPEHSVRRSKSAKSVTFAEDLESEMDSAGSPRSKARSKTSPKVSPSSKGKRVATSKREPEPEGPVSSFKSLRSNDMRYSDYAVSKVKSEPEQEQDLLPREREPQPLEANTNIVVSIPPSQLGKSYVDAEDFELKTANRKGVGHLPKLKIELNSMKSKLSMPLSAGPRLEDTSTSSSSGQQLDLETYAKNIGLKPIEQPLVSQSVAAPTDSKYSPNASPMSSCSSSTNGSSCSLGTADASTSTTTSSSSSHRKRKKKHSKEPKDANGKRKKLHAEISSQTDGKMKVKITAKPNHKLDLKRSHSLASGELALQQLKLDSTSSTSEALNRTLGEEARSISSLMVGGAPTPPPTPTTEPEQVAVPKAKDLTLPTSPPLPPSLFKAFTPSTAPSVPKQPAPQQPVKSNLPKPPLSSNNNRKPSSGGHFVVPQAPPTNRNMYHMQRYLSTPSSIASAANKQPKRSLSLDESHPSAKQARLGQAQAMASYAAKMQMQQSNNKQAAAFLPNPQVRSYGPEMGKPSLPLLCPANLSLSLPSSGQVTITPRPRSTSSYAFPEPTSHVPALEIVRLPASKPKMPPLSPPATSGGGGQRLMGPPAALPKQVGHAKMPLPLPLPLPMTTIPAIVKSPPLSVALSGQRSSNKSNSNSNSNAYRTSPPALINLRNTAPATAFPSKSSPKVEANSKKSPPAADGQGKTNGTAALDKSKTSLREFRPAVQAAVTATTAATAGATKDADILDLSANPGRNSTAKLAPTSPPAASSNTSNTNNSLEAALNKIKQNISANSNGGSGSNSNGNSNGDDLQNLHLLSESATAREKISIKAASSGGSSNNNTASKPKNANALVRPQNASVRSIPNPSALAFRNQPVAASATISKPLTVRAEEKPKMTTSNPGLLSPTSSSSSSSSSSGSNSGCSAATSPRAMTKKPTTIDQVAANLNIRAEAKAAALAEEAPPVAAKSPELAKIRTEPKETAITVSAASTLLSIPSSGVPESSLAKPPVQIANAPVASSA